MEKKSIKVCVTGASSYIGSWLVNKLLQKGYTVHATLRNSGDESSKVGLLKRMKGAESNLLLFEADIYNAPEFEPAIQGCEFVFLVATPYLHYASSKYKDTTEAAVAAVSSILKCCQRLGSVKRVIYTGSVTAASPLKEDGTGFKDYVDESCWTPLHLSFAHCLDFEKDYTCSKTLAEKQLLDYKPTEENSKIEVVSLACGLVGGDALVPNAPSSVQMFVSPITGDPVCYRQLKFLQALLGSVPSVHIEDVTDAHIFCMEKASLSGRFLCASAYPTMQEIVNYYEGKYPEIRVKKEYEETEEAVKCNSQKLINEGFRYKHGMEDILDDCVECVKRLKGLEQLS